MNFPSSKPPLSLYATVNCKHQPLFDLKPELMQDCIRWSFINYFIYQRTWFSSIAIPFRSNCIPYPLNTQWHTLPNLSGKKKWWWKRHFFAQTNNRLTSLRKSLYQYTSFVTCENYGTIERTFTEMVYGICPRTEPRSVCPSVHRGPVSGVRLQSAGSESSPDGGSVVTGPPNHGT